MILRCIEARNLSPPFLRVLCGLFLSTKMYISEKSFASPPHPFTLCKIPSLPSVLNLLRLPAYSLWLILLTTKGTEILHKVHNVETRNLPPPLNFLNPCPYREQILLLCVLCVFFLRTLCG